MRNPILTLLAAALICSPALAQPGPGPVPNLSVGQNGANAPTSSTQVGSMDGSGKLQPASTAHPLPVVVSGGGSNNIVYGPTAVGSPAANPPVLVGGTANGTGTGTTQVLAVDSGGRAAIQAPPSLPLPTGAAQDATLDSIISTLGSPLQAGGSVGIDQLTPNANGVTTLSGSVTAVSNALVPQGNNSPWNPTDGTKTPLTTGCAAVSALLSLTTNTLYSCITDLAGRAYSHAMSEGLTASGVSATENPMLNGGRAATTEPAAVTDGQKVAWMLSPSGKGVVLPYAPPALQVSGMATSTDTAAHTIITAPAGSLKNKIVSVQCYNTSSTNVLVTFNDAAASQLIVPAGGGNNPQYLVPLTVAAATAFTFTSGSGQTTIGCAAQGFTAN